MADDAFARLVRLVRALRRGLKCAESKDGPCIIDFDDCHDKALRAELRECETFIERANREKAKAPS